MGNGNGWDGGAGIQGIAPGASVTAYMVFYQREGRLGGGADICVDDAGKGVDLDKPSIRDAVSSGARIINMSYVDDIGDPSGVRDDILYALRHGGWSRRGTTLSGPACTTWSASRG